jgi:hypothetical protein
MTRRDGRKATTKAAQRAGYAARTDGDHGCREAAHLQARLLGRYLRVISMRARRAPPSPKRRRARSSVWSNASHTTASLFCRRSSGAESSPMATSTNPRQERGRPYSKTIPPAAQRLAWQIEPTGQRAELDVNRGLQRQHLAARPPLARNL